MFYLSSDCQFSEHAIADILLQFNTYVCLTNWTILYLSPIINFIEWSIKDKIFCAMSPCQVIKCSRTFLIDCVWNVMAHGVAREEKWRGNKRMEWVTSKRHMTAEHRLARAVQTLQADARTSAASSRLNWRPRRFKWTRPFRRKNKSGFCACAITFQTQFTHAVGAKILDPLQDLTWWAQISSSH